LKTKILVLGDTHVGSLYALMPPGFVGSDDREVSLNAGQVHLWNCWEHLCAEVAKEKIDAVVHNGDIVDGHQQAQRGTELCLPIWADQAEAAIVAMKPLLKAAGNPTYYQIQGTEYHDDKGGAAAEQVARGLGATKFAGLGTGQYSRDCLDLDIDGVVLDFCHHIQGAGGLYRGTPTDREGIFSALAGKDGKAPKADGVFRSHLHYFVHTEHASKHICIVPCWQLQTRFMRKLSRYRMIPDIGAIIVTVDPEAKRAGEDPISIRKILYPMPVVGTTKLRRAK
jgi:Calcineurin-like phosphoesterase